jgi:hypothetical protein
MEGFSNGKTNYHLNKLGGNGWGFSKGVRLFLEGALSKPITTSS